MIFNDVELAYGKDSCRALSALPCIPVDYFCQATPCCNEECVYAVSFPLEWSALRQRQSTKNIFTCIWRDCVYCLSSSLSFFCFKIIFGRILDKFALITTVDETVHALHCMYARIIFITCYDIMIIAYRSITDRDIGQCIAVTLRF